MLTALMAFLLLAIVGYSTTPAQYVSEAILALDVRKLQALPTESVVSPLPQESPVLRTELDIISSRMMAGKVLTRLDGLGFDADGRINPADQHLSANINIPESLSPLSEQMDEDRNRSRIDKLLSNVSVMNDGRSYTIYISYKADSPQYSAAVANAFGESYLDYQIDLQTSATRRVSEWLGGKLINLRATLEQSERAAADFREKSGLVKANGMTLQSQQIAALNAELANLRAKLAGAEARLSTAIDASNNKSGVALSEILGSPAIQQLRAEQSRVERSLQEISQSGASQSVQLPQLNSQLASLKSQIAGEVQQVIDSLRNEINVTHRQQGAVEANLKEMQDGMSAANQALVHADQLDREASANRAIYESYLTRYKQTIEQDGIATAEARMISRAVPARSKASPHFSTWLAIGAIGGVFSGFCLSLILDLKDKSIRSVKALESAARTPIIGRIPRLSSGEQKNVAHIVGEGRYRFARAIADLQAHLLLSSPQKIARAIAVTSAGTQEGKTLVVAGLARSLAATGVRTIIIDANFRAPMVAQEFGDQFGPYLEDVIRGRKTLEAAIQHDLFSSIDFVATQACSVPAEFLLGHQQFAKLINTLKQQYDIVLIDTPAVCLSADAIRVASLADTTLLVARCDKANTDDIISAVKMLTSEGRKLSGIVINSDQSVRDISQTDQLPPANAIAKRFVKEIASYARSRSSVVKA
ncbi:capsular exopolysaccharide family [Phyllobacterium sp. OV277]|nr:capsular exopolysaccharide family [Phyllobacterium sp. OV277]